MATLVKPGQAKLVVEKDQSPPLSVEAPSGVRHLEWLTHLAPVVMVVRIENIFPELTPDGDWITSTVHGSVEEVLKSTSRAISPGQGIRFRQDAGQMNIAGTNVHAVLVPVAKRGNTTSERGTPLALAADRVRAAAQKDNNK